MTTFLGNRAGNYLSDGRVAFWRRPEANPSSLIFNGREIAEIDPESFPLIGPAGEVSISATMLLHCPPIGLKNTDESVALYIPVPHLDGSEDDSSCGIVIETSVNQSLAGGPGIQMAHQGAGIGINTSMFSDSIGTGPGQAGQASGGGSGDGIANNVSMFRDRQIAYQVLYEGLSDDGEPWSESIPDQGEAVPIYIRCHEDGVDPTGTGRWEPFTSVFGAVVVDNAPGSSFVAQVSPFADTARDQFAVRDYLGTVMWSVDGAGNMAAHGITMTPGGDGINMSDTDLTNVNSISMTVDGGGIDLNDSDIFDVDTLTMLGGGGGIEMSDTLLDTVNNIIMTDDASGGLGIDMNGSEVADSGNISGRTVDNPTITKFESWSVEGSTNQVKTRRTIAAGTALGNAGEWCFDSNYVYFCIATDTWVRSKLNNFPL